MAIRRARSVRGGGSKRETEWISIAPTLTVFTAAGGTILNTASAGLLTKRPFTIIRTHLTVLMTSDQLAADELQGGALGMCLVSDQAAAIGVTAVPTPVTDQGSDLWYLHQWIMNDFAFVTGVGFDGQAGRLVHIDSKAMRKVNGDQDILLVGELSSVISSGFSFAIAGRMLIKEH